MDTTNGMACNRTRYLRAGRHNRYDRRQRMIRPTVARVDLGAITRNFRRITEHLARERPAGRRRRLRWSRRTRTATAPARSARALEDAGADLLACADIEEGAALRAAGVQADILIFGALSVSDLDGLFDCGLTPTISTPGAARAVQTAAAKYKRRLPYHLKIDTGMNRLGFRYDNLRRTLPELFASENLELRRRLHAFRDGRRARLAAVQRAAVAVRARAGRHRRHQPRDPAASQRDPSAVRARVQQCRAAAGCARVVRPRPARPAVVRHCSAAARVDDRARAGDDARQPRRRREGHPSGRRRRLRRAVQGRRAEIDGGDSRRLCRRPRSSSRRPRRRAHSRAPRADRRCGVDGHARRRRHRPRRGAGRRSRDPRIAGRRPHRRPRDGGHHRNDSVGDRLPHRHPDTSYGAI